MALGHWLSVGGVALLLGAGAGLIDSQVPAQGCAHGMATTAFFLAVMGGLLASQVRGRGFLCLGLLTLGTLAADLAAEALTERELLTSAEASELYPLAIAAALQLALGRLPLLALLLNLSVCTALAALAVGLTSEAPGHAALLLALNALLLPIAAGPPRPT